MEQTISPNDILLKKERNYGIDLLRLVSMLMVVILHVLGQGGILKNISNLTLKGESFWSLEILCYCAVNVYAIISGYVGYKSKHRGRSLVSLCLQVLFFSMLITGADLLIALRNGSPISLASTVLNFLPSIRSYWYFSAYFCLFFFMPILDKIIDCVPRKNLRSAAAFCFLIFCCWTQLYTKVSNLNGGYSVLWLAVLYLVGAYISRYDPLKKWSFPLCFSIFLAFIALTVAVRISLGLVTRPIFGSPKGMNLLVSYTSPTITLAAFFLVYSFSKAKFNAVINKIISVLTPLSFGVYLIHCHPIVFSRMQGSFTWILQKPTFFGLLSVLGISFSIFSVCLLLDWIRFLLFKVCKIQQFSTWIEKKAKAFYLFILRILHIQAEDIGNE